MAAQAIDHLAEYVQVLQGFGLPSAEIRSHHGVEDGDEAALRTAIRAEVGEDPTDRALYRRAHRLLAHSSRGIDVRKRFWNHAPSTQLDDVFGAYGCQFRVLDPETGAPTDCSTHHGPVELVLREPSSGQVRRTHFSFPDTPLDDDNYPALIATVNEELLPETSLRFVLLTNEIDHWRFVLVEQTALRRLRARHGDRIEVFGQSLLRDNQPTAFATDIDTLSADGLARLPPELVPEPGDSLSGSRSLADRTGASFDAVADDVDGTAAASYDHGDNDGPSVEALANAADPRTVVADGGAGTASRSLGGRPSEATEERVAELFADVDEVSLSKTEVERYRSDGPETTGSVDIGPDDYAPSTEETTPEGDLDEVFEHVEAVAAETPVGEAGGDPGVTSSDVLDALEHENAGSDPAVEDGFIWVDPDQLTPTPEAVYEAMLGG